VAELASYIEIGKLGRPIGLQDQFAASFGGLNAIEFTARRTVVRPLELPLHVRDHLERSLLLFYTGASRNAATILKEQRASSQGQDATVIESLHGIKRDAEIARDALRAGDVRQIGQILHQSWQRKKRLAKGISNERIDRLYQLALEHGASGGKIAGAGGGGFLLLYCEPEYQPTVTQVLESEGLARMTFHFDDGGAQVLVNSMPEIPGLEYPEGRWVGSGVASV
jgi:D-glycero-alpha-D-manno-heptose-7-phosphate kinase